MTERNLAHQLERSTRQARVAQQAVSIYSEESSGKTNEVMCQESNNRVPDSVRKQVV